MASFLLIHGAWHGAWCWRDVLPLLREAGHTARAIDLPSHGNDRTPPEDVTLATYAEAIRAAIDEPTILLGHSMGGYPITAAAERSPADIEHLVYLCAYAPLSGLSLAEMRKRAARQPLVEAMIRSDDGKTVSLDPTRAEALLYHDCPPGTIEYALPRMTSQPIEPQETPLDVTETSAAVPASYILCEDDRAIPPEYQAEMAERCDEVYRLPCGHSPFFAMPQRLADTLIRITEKS
ncbi:alpha/beta fold hydrolase [Roseitranquillus sediminis]|uniref:alpha/beta fold hydrolase n=1 Tax=Roseitranquillus sediminis TaxID=2809051 RepID=UPI001D0C22D7|nr:alpha/beta fold hydrolase [Roseitranquillus sediminis]MBM9593089.1 alpha/beta fold hydrolase [Roseitranquillus sediminis]